VSTIGHPLHLDWVPSINVNTVALLSDGGDFRKLRFTKSGIERGYSGGPVFTDQGALVGMVTKVDPIHVIAVKMDAVLAVLREEWRIPTPNLAQPTATATGTLFVESRPPGAQLFLDGRPAGSTTGGPVTLSGLSPGRYALRLTKEGFAPWEQPVTVEPGTERSVVAELGAATPSLAAPILIAPTDGATIHQIHEAPWQFRWRDPAGPEGQRQYHLVVTREGSRSPLIDIVTTNTSHSYTRTPCSRMIGDVRLDWRWRVRAQDPHGAWSPWSQEHRFNVGDINRKVFCERCPSGTGCPQDPGGAPKK
jgi:hypothetical protein